MQRTELSNQKLSQSQCCTEWCPQPHAPAIHSQTPSPHVKVGALSDKRKSLCCSCCAMRTPSGVGKLGIRGAIASKSIHVSVNAKRVIGLDQSNICLWRTLHLPCGAHGATADPLCAAWCQTVSSCCEAVMDQGDDAFAETGIPSAGMQPQPLSCTLCSVRGVLTVPQVSCKFWVSMDVDSGRGG